MCELFMEMCGNFWTPLRHYRSQNNWFLCLKGNHSMSGYHQPGNVNVSYIMYLHLWSTHITFKVLIVSEDLQCSLLSSWLNAFKKLIWLWCLIFRNELRWLTDCRMLLIEAVRRTVPAGNSSGQMNTRSTAVTLISVITPHMRDPDSIIYWRLF